MSLEQQVTALVASANALTGAVNGKIAQIDQKTQENTAKVDSELSKIQTKLPRIVITKNQVLSINPDTGLPAGMSIHERVTTTLYMTINNWDVKSAENMQLLQQMEQDMGVDLRKTAHYRREFNIFKMKWDNHIGWVAFPLAADDFNATSIPVNTFITLGAFVKVLSGGVKFAWAEGSQIGKWVFCNSKLVPSGFGSYLNLHPITTTESGELLVALPAAITGHIDDGGQWFPNVGLN
ncbi:hypothetical protein KO537_22595 [Shewanella sp. NKUCC01_JLK]|uniref:hypothetical protein n=1 Tax=Shewanella sp. NKUCC01_JLK TaxID=2842123 RepID=UPI001C5B488F|nr:hypothetical protein [Shewanella sp. NKUCC01_JLK]MBW3517481.1 hypothetical protein [Shewanella sp. NKUCC01_JLK]